MSDALQFADRMCQEHYGYVTVRAHAYASGDPCLRDDYIQEGLLGIVYACRGYDPNRNVPFLAWAIRPVNNRMRDFQIKQQRHAAASVDVLHENGVEIVDDRAGRGFEKEEAALHDALAKLPADQRDVIHLIYFDGLNASEASRRTGISTRTLQWRHQTAIKKLRGLLKDVRAQL